MASRFYKRIALLATLPLLAISCVDKNYDIAKLDKEMTLFGNGINVPVGSTSKILLDKIFDIESQGGEYLSTDAAGNYVLQFKNTDAGMSASFNIPAMNFENAISIESDTTTVNAAEFAGLIVPADQEKTYTLNKLEIPIDLDVAVPDGLSDIKWIELNSSMNLILDANIPIANLKAGYGINFPSFMTLEAIGSIPGFKIENDHIIRFVETVNLGTPKSFKVAIKKMDISKLPAGQGVKDGRLVVHQTAVTEGNEVLVIGDGATQVPATVDLIIDGSIDNVSVSQINAKISKSVDIPTSVTKISGLPEFLKKSTIKMDNCTVKFLVNNDSPFDLTMGMLISSTGGNFEGQNELQLSDLQINKGKNVLFLSNGSAPTPADATASVIVPNINDVFGGIPEQISIKNGTAALKADGYTTIPGNISGQVSAGFEFSAPLSFQAGGELSFDMSISDLNLNLESYGAEAIQIAMDAVNAIPMDFNITLGKAYDSSGTPINPKLEINPSIKAGTLAAPATTHVTLSLSAPGVKSVGRLELVLTATSKGGEKLNKDQFMQFSNIIASLPNGITITPKN
ncbi:MAG: hypothetical protein IJU63_05520 [Bacteroidales bacterium]|nr:hypothetical protein [Bacteroidales bacterium]